MANLSRIIAQVGLFYATDDSSNALWTNGKNFIGGKK